MPSTSSLSSSSLWQAGWGHSNPSAYAPAYFFTKASNGTSAANKAQKYTKHYKIISLAKHRKLEMYQLFITHFIRWIIRRKVPLQSMEFLEWDLNTEKNLSVAVRKRSLTFLGELHKLLFLLSSYFHSLLLLYCALLIFSCKTHTCTVKPRGLVSKPTKTQSIKRNLW